MNHLLGTKLGTARRRGDCLSVLSFQENGGGVSPQERGPPGGSKGSEAAHGVIHY